jgi:hypothetical protein
MRFAAICLPAAVATGYSQAKAEGAQQVRGESGAAIETAPRENATGIRAAKNQPTVGEKPEPAAATQPDVEANEMSAPEDSEHMGEAGAPDNQWALQPGELAPREIVMEFVEHLESPDDKARTLYIQACIGGRNVAPVGCALVWSRGPSRDISLMNVEEKGTRFSSRQDSVC